MTISNTFSSTSPLILLPAIILATSSDTILISLKDGGTRPSAIFCARPSTNTVLPTPASPTTIGLFFLLLLSILIMFPNSSSLPTSGSNLPSLANSTKSLPIKSNILLCSGPPIFISGFASTPNGYVACSERYF
ncbi:MAG: hypothetical protein UR45_C0032G0004 [candidate division WS6 bacterium GW2011_WS6_33_547]|nr:MAG: hypothetical protein UR45_C0032G0004 [candidate division WS6 bacterium GW2011_WS6_33_547]